MALSAIEVNNLKQAPAFEGVLPAVLSRWSALSFANREVSPALLTKVFEAARWTASARNDQPWRFLVGTRNSLTFKKISDTLEANKAWAEKAPVLILGVAKIKFSLSDTQNDWAIFDLGAATSYLTLQATALGLTTHQIASYDKAAIRRDLAIPKDYALGAVIALGYQGEPGALGNEQLIARETAPRTRMPLNELVFSAWDTPAKLG